MALWRATAKACASYAAIYKYSVTFLTESNEIIKMQYFIVFAGFFAMSALLMATFYWLPKGQAAHDKFIFKCGVNFTAILRGNSKWKHVIYRSEEHTSELQSLMRISYAVFCLKKK